MPLIFFLEVFYSLKLSIIWLVKQQARCSFDESLIYAGDNIHNLLLWKIDSWSAPNFPLVHSLPKIMVCYPLSYLFERFVKGKIHTGGTHQSGNIDRVIFNLGGNGELKFNKERIELKFFTIYSEEYDNITSRNTFGL